MLICARGRPASGATRVRRHRLLLRTAAAESYPCRGGLCGGRLAAHPDRGDDFPPLEIPAWALRFVVITILAGFPMALVLSWAFDVGPHGFEVTDACHAGGRLPAGAASEAPKRLSPRRGRHGYRGGSRVCASGRVQLSRRARRNQSRCCHSTISAATPKTPSLLTVCTMTCSPRLRTSAS